MRFTRLLRPALLLVASLSARTCADLTYVSYDYEYVSNDNTTPGHASELPANGTTDVRVDTLITITFSERIVAGSGQLVVSSPVDVRRVPALDAQVSIDTSTNLTLELRLLAPLLSWTVYDVFATPGVAVDFAGNNFQGSRFQFTTKGENHDFVAFAPFVQAPDSPVAFAFKTTDHCLYGSSTDQYYLSFWPSENDTFYAPPLAGLGGTGGLCSVVTEASTNFPAIDECRVLDGRFQVALREALSSVTEYSLVLQWPVRASAINTTVIWQSSVSRTYRGVVVEVQHFLPWIHDFRDYFFNNVNDSRGAVVSFNMTPADGTEEWLGPSTVREFIVDLQLSSPGLLPGSRLLLLASPLASGWSTNPARPSNLTLFKSLTYLDPRHLSDSTRRASPCLHFFPGNLPFSVQCRHLELGVGTHAYGIELLVPARGLGATVAGQSDVPAVSFRLVLPGVPQPLAMVSYWEAILVQVDPASSVGSTQSTRVKSDLPTLLNSTEGMMLEVLSSSFPYPAPVGTRLNTVELEFATGILALGRVEVTIELLEPLRARLEACEAVAGVPRLSLLPPNITDEPVSKIHWASRDFTVYPHMRYRAVCTLYNGPHPVPSSAWRLNVTSFSSQGGTVGFSRTFCSHTYYVAAVLAGAQVIPTLPVVGRLQVLFVRVTMPLDDGVVLKHWTTAARRLQVSAPDHFEFFGGPCAGFRPLSSSAMPALPLVSCSRAASGQAFELQIDEREPGFKPGCSYAFRVVLGNPRTWAQVQSRLLGTKPVPLANRWSISLLRNDGLPIAMLEDVPMAYSASTAALRPEMKPQVYDTSFRIYQRLVTLHSFHAEEPYLGHTTHVTFRFALSTPLRASDALQITAPTGFAWVQTSLEHSPQALHGTQPFPGRDPEVGPTNSILCLSVAVSGAEASVQYGLVLNIVNPATWSELERDLNFWMLETFYNFGGALDKRSRRDVVVQQGYLLKGTLTHCAAMPSSRSRGEVVWVSLTFKVNEPVFYRSWTQPVGPSELHVRVPNGFRFPAAPVGGNCSGLLLAEAPSDSPPLRPAQFPHAYSPLPYLDGFKCRLDSAHLEVARTLVLGAVQQESFGLLPHVLYAFQLRVVNPTFDRIFDTQWTFSTIRVSDGAVSEQCDADSSPGLEPALATLVPAQSESAGMANGMLPTQRAAVTFELSSSSPIVASAGPKTLDVMAPPGYAFLRRCVASVTTASEDNMTSALTSCNGRGAVATLQLQLSTPAAALAVTVHVRLPSRLHKGQRLTWSFWSLQDPIGYGTSALLGPRARVMEQFALQPLGVPFFTLGLSGQHAVLSVTPSATVPTGGTLEVAAPRHASFTFYAQGPCAAVHEESQATEAAQTDQVCHALGAGSGASDSSACQWPAVHSCDLAHWGTRLWVKVLQALERGVTYCFDILLDGPAVSAGSGALLGITCHDSDGGVVDLALAFADGSNGLVPFAPEIDHLSLCHGSRVPGSLPRELMARFVPSGLSAGATGAMTEGWLCFHGVAVASGVVGGAACRITEPRSDNSSGTGVSGALPSCAALSEADCRGVCVVLLGEDLWVSSRPVVVSLPVLLLPGSAPRADLRIFDTRESVVQASTTSADVSVLDELTGLRLVAPPTASTAAAFPVVLSIDWPLMGLTFLQRLLETEEEELAFLDVLPPPGVRASLSCRPVACSHIVPDAATPRAGVRLFLLEAAAAGPQRRLWQRRQLLQRRTASSSRHCEANPAHGTGALRCAHSQQSRSLLASRFFNLSELPAEVSMYVTVASPLTPLTVTNVWDFVLRSRALRALGAVALPGFGVARHMNTWLETSSEIAGDVFSHLAVAILLEAPLSAGDVVVLVPPSLEFDLRPELVEPAELVGPSVAEAVPLQSPGSCVLQLRQELLVGVWYSFSLPLTNPVVTPNPNRWSLQAFSRWDGAEGWDTHSTADVLGFQVSGEFEFLRVLAKSAAPHVFTPAAIYFQLRTPLHAVHLASPDPGLQEPAVKLRLVVLNGSSVASVVAFDPAECLLDSFQGSDLVEPVPNAEILQPDDCLVTSNGAAVEFFFHRADWGRNPFVIWTRLYTPTLEAAADPAWIYMASTSIRGSVSVVHRTSLRPTPLLNLHATVSVGSRAAGAAHRAVVTVTAGQTVLGQRGAIEVTLPLGFVGSCSRDHFRPRPALPETARCRAHAASEERGGLIVVYWRSLFRAGGLRPPYEFSFGLGNSNSTSQGEGPGGAWHVRIFEGEHLEFPVDGTLPDGLRPFDLCTSLNLTHRREDARIVSVFFNGHQDLPDSFENAVRVELQSSARAPAALACPETSMWQRRPEVLGSVQGLPNYTVCVPEPQPTVLPAYQETAQQHQSAVLFLLPSGPFPATEPQGLEVSISRITEAQEAELWASEGAAELLSLQLMSSGVQQECGSVPLGPVPGAGAA